MSHEPQPVVTSAGEHGAAGGAPDDMVVVYLPNQDDATVFTAQFKRREDAGTENLQFSDDEWHSGDDALVQRVVHGPTTTSDCLACQGRSQRHTCHRTSGCKACAGRHVAHSCGKVQNQGNYDTGYTKKHKIVGCHACNGNHRLHSCDKKQKSRKLSGVVHATEITACIRVTKKDTIIPDVWRA